LKIGADIWGAGLRLNTVSELHMAIYLGRSLHQRLTGKLFGRKSHPRTANVDVSHGLRSIQSIIQLVLVGRWHPETATSRYEGSIVTCVTLGPRNVFEIGTIEVPPT
jgi:hypothetical protein